MRQKAKKITTLSSLSGLVGLPARILPKPAHDGGKSVLASLWKRKTDRNISGKKISPRMLSNILWAACGNNRRKGPFGIPGRTAASASNSQEIELFVALQEGFYLYDPHSHRLLPVVAGDLRRMALGKGQGGMGAKAPVRLIYVVDAKKFSRRDFRNRACGIGKRKKPITMSTRA
jgi:hypothetical protein